MSLVITLLRNSFNQWTINQSPFWELNYPFVKTLIPFTKWCFCQVWLKIDPLILEILKIFQFCRCIFLLHCYFLPLNKRDKEMLGHIFILNFYSIFFKIQCIFLSLSGALDFCYTQRFIWWSFNAHDKKKNQDVFVKHKCPHNRQFQSWPRSQGQISWYQ